MPIGLKDVVEVVTFQWKAGGWIALACAAVGGVIGSLQVSIYQCPGGYSVDHLGKQVCSAGETFDFAALGTILGAVMLGGFIGVVIAAILLALGMRHDTLGIDPDA